MWSRPFRAPYPCPIKVEGIPKAEARDLALRLLEKVELGDKAEGYTIVVVTHEMDFAGMVSDQVVFLDKWLIIERAPPEIFFSNPTSERVRRFLDRQD